MKDTIQTRKNKVKENLSLLIYHIDSNKLPFPRKLPRRMSFVCPFHGGTAKDFIIDRDGNFFHCLGCGKGGDIFAYVMDIENISFAQALKKLEKLIEDRDKNPQMAHFSIGRNIIFQDR